MQVLQALLQIGIGFLYYKKCKEQYYEVGKCICVYIYIYTWPGEI